MKENDTNQNQEHIFQHPYKWNHSTYVCLCNGGDPNTENLKNARRYRKKQKNDPNTSTSSDQCYSQIMYDTDLSDVSDTDCSCSDCMQANLNAYNDFLKQQKQPKPSKRSQTQEKKPKKDNLDSSKRTNKKEPNKFKYLPKQTKKHPKNQHDTVTNSPKKDISEDDCSMNSQDQFNDYILITRNRARKYLQQRKKLKDQEENKKKELKEKIKHNLQVLRYAAKLNRKVPPYMEENQQPYYPHEFKWNHSKYKPNQSKHPKFQCCHFDPKDQLKEKLSTNLEKFNPEFQMDRQKFLENVKQKRLEQLNKKAPQHQYQNYHMKISRQKIKKMQKFIMKKAKQYKRKKRLEKKKKEDEEKIRQAKLRAIDLKCKNIVQNSKKYDPSTSRTSFKLSIDNFDTFSELRQAKQARDNEKKFKNNKKYPKKLVNAIYEDLDQQEEFEINNKHKSNKPKSQRQNLPKEDDQSDLPNPKIIKQARIYPPKSIKPTDKQHNKINDKKQPRNLADLAKEEKKNKQIQAEIIKKKQAILQQFQKRNSTAKPNKNQPPKNKALRQEYQNSLNKDKKNKRNTPQKYDIKDPYRNNYRPEKQTGGIANPWIKQQLYHENLANVNNKKSKKKGKSNEDQIYQKNINKLLKKQRLQI